MRDTTIARSYAETFLVLAGKAEDLRGWGRMLADVAKAMETNPQLRLFLESRLPLPGSCGFSWNSKTPLWPTRWKWCSKRRAIRRTSLTIPPAR